MFQLLHLCHLSTFFTFAPLHQVPRNWNKISGANASPTFNDTFLTFWNFSPSLAFHLFTCFPLRTILISMHLYLKSFLELKYGPRARARPTKKTHEMLHLLHLFIFAPFHLLHICSCTTAYLQGVSQLQKPSMFHLLHLFTFPPSCLLYHLWMCSHFPSFHLLSLFTFEPVSTSSFFQPIHLDTSSLFPLFHFSSFPSFHILRISTCPCLN